MEIKFPIEMMSRQTIENAVKSNKMSDDGIVSVYIFPENWRDGKIKKAIKHAFSQNQIVEYPSGEKTVHGEYEGVGLVFNVSPVGEIRNLKPVIPSFDDVCENVFKGGFERFGPFKDFWRTGIHTEKAFYSYLKFYENYLLQSERPGNAMDLLEKQFEILKKIEGSVYSELNSPAELRSLIRDRINKKRYENGEFFRKTYDNGVTEIQFPIELKTPEKVEEFFNKSRHYNLGITKIRFFPSSWAKDDINKAVQYLLKNARARSLSSTQLSYEGTYQGVNLKLYTDKKGKVTTIFPSEKQ